MSNFLQVPDNIFECKSKKSE